MDSEFVSSETRRLADEPERTRVPRTFCEKLTPGLRAEIPHPSDFDPTNTTIFIGGLSGNVNEHTLRDVFGQFGDIIYTKVPANKGCGFCQFVERRSAEQAMQQLQGQVPV